MSGLGERDGELMKRPMFKVGTTAVLTLLSQIMSANADVSAQPFINVANCISGGCSNDIKGKKLLGEQCMYLYMLADRYGYASFPTTQINSCTFHAITGMTVWGGDPSNILAQTQMSFRNGRAYIAQGGNSTGTCINPKTNSVQENVSGNRCLYQ